MIIHLSSIYSWYKLGFNCRNLGVSREPWTSAAVSTSRRQAHPRRPETLSPPPPGQAFGQFWVKISCYSNIHLNITLYIYIYIWLFNIAMKNPWKKHNSMVNLGELLTGAFRFLLWMVKLVHPPARHSIFWHRFAGWSRLLGSTFQQWKRPWNYMKLPSGKTFT